MSIVSSPFPFGDVSAQTNSTTGKNVAHNCIVERNVQGIVNSKRSQLLQTVQSCIRFLNMTGVIPLFQQQQQQQQQQKERKKRRQLI